jgi:hypothetical protein
VCLYFFSFLFFPIFVTFWFSRVGFRRSLSKRLLTQKIKEDWEQHFLTKLKGVCGDAYTKKLTGML